ncbi:hypothetical protein [Pleomorphomonas sp. PLEO]|uniref:hypothetical protein n=1 Tax=Pleomorphomonas sp. PLEO TaxID=3239306 RepID=UPI00351EAA31
MLGLRQVEFGLDFTEMIDHQRLGAHGVAAADGFGDQPVVVARQTTAGLMALCP